MTRDDFSKLIAGELSIARDRRRGSNYYRCLLQYPTPPNSPIHSCPSSFAFQPRFLGTACIIADHRNRVNVVNARAPHSLHRSTLSRTYGCIWTPDTMQWTDPEVSSILNIMKIVVYLTSDMLAYETVP